MKRCNSKKPYDVFTVPIITYIFVIFKNKKKISPRVTKIQQNSDKAMKKITNIKIRSLKIGPDFGQKRLFSFCGRIWFCKPDR